jgi:hypothetical protein
MLDQQRMENQARRAACSCLIQGGRPSLVRLIVTRTEIEDFRQIDDTHDQRWLKIDGRPIRQDSAVADAVTTVFFGMRCVQGLILLRWRSATPTMSFFSGCSFACNTCLRHALKWATQQVADHQQGKTEIPHHPKLHLTRTCSNPIWIFPMRHCEQWTIPGAIGGRFGPVSYRCDKGFRPLANDCSYKG